MSTDRYNDIARWVDDCSLIFYECKDCAALLMPTIIAAQDLHDDFHSILVTVAFNPFECDRDLDR